MKNALSMMTAALLAATALQPAQAADPESCKTVNLSDPGWTDINSTNGIATTILEGLGYDPIVTTLSVPIGYQAMKNGEIDVFLGNWMPAQQKFIDELNEAKAVDVLNKNLAGAKFTLAVPSYISGAGVSDFSNLAEHAEKFDSKIHGIAPGSPANANIQRMIDSGDFGLKEWEVVESSEQGVLSQVSRNVRREKWIVFLAWAPHPMNNEFDLTYLSGGDEYFGPNFGGADVFTLSRTGWSGECANAAKFFENLTFTVEMESALMGNILNDGLSPEDAATQWLQNNPASLTAWLDGVQTLDGQNGLEAVRAHLGIQ
ncbi:choline ABC transporter substrate-binding protein [Kiloniella sp. b19]|uniref:choline ABC transporter substrate-binding protein n=1 Tax=Kiloniella sp. GXU_MW_B19 TaxID=3141326 RepID=UPI0031CE00BC